MTSRADRPATVTDSTKELQRVLGPGQTDLTSELQPAREPGQTDAPVDAQTPVKAQTDAPVKAPVNAAINALREDHSFFRDFLDALGDALFVVDRERRIVFWNRKAEQLTGFTSQDVLGKYCLNAIRCEKCLYTCELFDRGEVRGVQITIVDSEERQLHCTKDAFLLRDADGEVLGGVELLRDETELVKRRATCQEQQVELEARERLNEAILSSIREGLITIDANKRVTSFSRRAEEITGRDAQWVIGRHCSEVLGSSLCSTDCPAERCVEYGRDGEERMSEITTASGQRVPIVTQAVPLRAGEGQSAGTVLLIEDRSQQHLLRRRAESVSFAGMIGRSRAMRSVFRVIEQVAPTDATVLITGESGTGKEMAARAIHLLSGRAEGPFEAVNSAAMPDTLLESEMFGHARGAFTGASRDRPGRIEEAEGGTLFLDEIGELTLPLQAKLLRFLQDREYTRLGENTPRRADVRIVAATNRDLAAEVHAKRFREDLLYRLRVIPLEMPALRERRDDIPLLAASLLEKVARRVGRQGMRLTAACMDHLCHHDWPGNVRELINALEYAAILARRNTIRVADLPPELRGEERRASAYTHDPGTQGDEAERIRRALADSGGNRSAAARLLGMNRVTLYRKLRKLGLQGG